MTRPFTLGHPSCRLARCGSNCPCSSPCDSGFRARCTKHYSYSLSYLENILDSGTRIGCTTQMLWLPRYGSSGLFCRSNEKRSSEVLNCFSISMSSRSNQEVKVLYSVLLRLHSMVKRFKALSQRIRRYCP